MRRGQYVPQPSVGRQWAPPAGSPWPLLVPPRRPWPQLAEAAQPGAFKRELVVPALRCQHDRAIGDEQSLDGAPGRPLTTVRPGEAAPTCCERRSRERCPLRRSSGRRRSCQSSSPWQAMAANYKPLQQANGVSARDADRCAQQSMTCPLSALRPHWAEVTRKSMPEV